MRGLGWRSRAFPVLACPGNGCVALRRRADARFARVGGRIAAITGLNRALTANYMVRSCPPNALRISRAAPIGWERLHAMIARKNRHDLARRGAASGCMRWLGGTTPEARADLPAMLAFAGVPCDGVRGRFSRALMGAMTVACVPGDGARGRCRRSGSHQDGGRMRALGCGSKAFPVMACPSNGCVPCDGARMPDSHGLAVGPRQSWG